MVRRREGEGGEKKGGDPHSTGLMWQGSSAGCLPVCSGGLAGS